MGGIAGFMGTFIIGPRVGMFKEDKTLAYIDEDIFLEDDDANKALKELNSNVNKRNYEE